MKPTLKYLWGSASIMYALSVASALLLGYWGWWVLLAGILALVTFGIWRRVS